MYAPLFPPYMPQVQPISLFYFITKWYLVRGPDYVFQMVGIFISMVYWQQLIGKGKLLPMHDGMIYGGVEGKLHKYLTSALCDGN